MVNSVVACNCFILFDVAFLFVPCEGSDGANILATLITLVLCKVGHWNHKLINTDPLALLIALSIYGIPSSVYPLNSSFKLNV